MNPSDDAPWEGEWRQVRSNCTLGPIAIASALRFMRREVTKRSSACQRMQTTEGASRAA